MGLIPRSLRPQGPVGHTSDVDNRLAQRLKRLLGLTNAPGLTAGGTVQPVVSLQKRGQLVYDPEALGANFMSRVAAAGNVNGFILGNPKASTRVLAVTDVIISASAATPVGLDFQNSYNTVAPTALAGVSLDRSGVFKRRSVVGEMAVVESASGVPGGGGGTVGAGGVLFDRLGAAGSIHWQGTEDNPLCLVWPDECVFARAFVVGLSSACTFLWTEFPLPTS